MQRAFMPCTLHHELPMLSVTAAGAVGCILTYTACMCMSWAGSLCPTHSCPALAHPSAAGCIGCPLTASLCMCPTLCVAPSPLPLNTFPQLSCYVWMECMASEVYGHVDRRGTR